MQVKQKNIMVVALVVLLVLALWYRMVYSSAQNAISKAKADTADAVQGAATARAQLSAPPKQTPKGSISSDQLQSALPLAKLGPSGLDVGISTFLRQIDKLKVQDRVDWATISPSPPILSGKLLTTTISITVGGSYDAVHAFADDLLSMPRLVLADSVSFTKGTAPGSSSAAQTAASATGPPTGHIFGAPGGTPSLQLQMTVRVFNQPPAGYALTTAGGGATTGASTGGSSAPASGGASAPAGK